MISFMVPYPGAAASVNHGYHIVYVKGRARLALTDEAEAFKAEVVVLAKQAIIAAQWHPAPRSCLWVLINGRFPNRKHADLHNMAKIILDGIEDALNCYVEGSTRHNDRDWGQKVGPPEYLTGEAMLEVMVYEHKRASNGVWYK